MITFTNTIICSVQMAYIGNIHLDQPHAIHSAYRFGDSNGDNAIMHVMYLSYYKLFSNKLHTFFLDLSNY